MKERMTKLLILTVILKRKVRRKKYMLGLLLILLVTEHQLFRESNLDELRISENLMDERLTKLPIIVAAIYIHPSA
jgi:hypothetical protein